MVDLERIIRELEEERNRIDGIIEAMERYNRVSDTVSGHKRRGRKFMSAEDRKEVSDRMKQYWAKRKAESNKKTKAAGSRAPQPEDHFALAAAS
jgi:hypothetical protein